MTSFIHYDFTVLIRFDVPIFNMICTIFNHILKLLPGGLVSGARNAQYGTLSLKFTSKPSYT